MSAPPQKSAADPKKIAKLLESHTAREAFEILAAQIILANKQTQDSPTRVQEETRKIKITERHLQEIRTGRFGRIQLPTEEEARNWLQLWSEATLILFSGKDTMFDL